MPRDSRATSCASLPGPRRGADTRWGPRAQVLEYCTFHVEAKRGEVKEEEKKTFDTDFVKVDQGTLFELILVRRALGDNKACCLAVMSHGQRYRGGALTHACLHPHQAANYMNIKELLDLTCQTVANMIKGAWARWSRQPCLFDTAKRQPLVVAWRSPPATSTTHRQDAGGDPQDVQHHERLFARGGGGGAIHECLLAMPAAPVADSRSLTRSR